MLSQDNKKMIKNKKGVSEIIGYILLISIAVVMSVIVYGWLRSYVPTEEFKCPDEVALRIDGISCSNNELRIDLTNSGKFSIYGYYIRGSASEEEVATEEIGVFGETKKDTKNIVFFTEIDPSSNGEKIPTDKDNFFYPGNKIEHTFVSPIPTVKFIEITPVRNQEEKGKFQTAVCTTAKIKEVLPTCANT